MVVQVEGNSICTVFLSALLKKGLYEKTGPSQMDLSIQEQRNLTIFRLRAATRKPDEAAMMIKAHFDLKQDITGG